MDAEKFWSTTEMNKFLYQQLKAMCEANGFVLSPRKGKHLVKIAERFVGIVCPEVSYGRTRIHVSISPAGSFANHIYAEKTFCPRGDKKEESEADQEDYNTVLEILSMMQRGDTKAQVIEKMQELERTALNKAWGVTLSSEGQTIRLKKKELF